MCQKIELAAHRATFFQKIPGGKHMRLQPVDFFAQVGLGRQQRRLGMQPLAVEARDAFDQCCDLAGKPAGDFLRRA
ncbi:MAG: hypothetical protein BGN83_08475 [Rhizobium sp. 63-7]|nr:MAG: hypothetical protein BGN83_08475 [Rhizobium sp. 63-7]